MKVFAESDLLSAFLYNATRWMIFNIGFSEWDSAMMGYVDVYEM